MIQKKCSKLFLIFIFLFSFITFASSGFALKNNATCEITNSSINCLNLHSSVVMKINLLNDPYRIKVKFENKLLIKKNKINNNELIKSVRVNQFSTSSSKFVIEFQKPTIISDIQYYKIDNQNFNLTMYFLDTSEVNYAIAKHTLHKNKGDIFSLNNDLKISSKNFDLPLIK